MNKPTSPVILAIGAHVGDMELTAGGLLSTCAMQNWTPVIISLTTSEKSASATDDLDKFIEMKRREATSFVTELHGQSIIYDIPDGFLVPTDSLCLDPADLRIHAGGHHQPFPMTVRHHCGHIDHIDPFG